MSTHASKSRPGGQESHPKSQDDGHASAVSGDPVQREVGHVDVIEAKLVQPVETEESGLPPSPAEYSVEVSFQSPVKAPPSPPPLPAQRVPSQSASKLESEKVVIAAPLSFAGSAARIWKLVGLSSETWARVLLAIAAVVLIALAWCFVLGWYLLWGILLVPYRLIRRGQRRRKREALQHREMIAASQEHDATTTAER